ncbi:hypothetical protein FYJ38_00315 [Clostridium sp. WB02_MRS01]|uniref:hypothetical protein n=1 Tax=Clostridium sp. WB02_MRS01 TaxID=2605777 RepID=UPI0012B1F8CB|nr:hypothetical protein [Clostridium sp. WB02_MRS01]MSS07082.1 hypothetical protein [Clostridium sp. WB02_MRS01]
MKVSCSYYYKGSTNIYLHMKQANGDEIQLSTDYGEKIKDVYTATDLIKTINNLESGKYA